MQEPSKSDVGCAFGEILYRAKKVVEIAVFGGAAILPRRAAIVRQFAERLA